FVCAHKSATLNRQTHRTVKMLSLTQERSLTKSSAAGAAADRGTKRSTLSATSASTQRSSSSSLGVNPAPHASPSTGLGEGSGVANSATPSSSSSSSSAAGAASSSSMIHGPPPLLYTTKWSASQRYLYRYLARRVMLHADVVPTFDDLMKFSKMVRVSFQGGEASDGEERLVDSDRQSEEDDDRQARVSSSERRERRNQEDEDADEDDEEDEEEDDGGERQAIESAEVLTTFFVADSNEDESISSLETTTDSRSSSSLTQHPSSKSSKEGAADGRRTQQHQQQQIQQHQRRVPPPVAAVLRLLILLHEVVVDADGHAMFLLALTDEADFFNVASHTVNSYAARFLDDVQLGGGGGGVAAALLMGGGRAGAKKRRQRDALIGKLQKLADGGWTARVTPVVQHFMGYVAAMADFQDRHHCLCNVLVDVTRSHEFLLATPLSEYFIELGHGIIELIKFLLVAHGTGLHESVFDDTTSATAATPTAGTTTFTEASISLNNTTGTNTSFPASERRRGNGCSSSNGGGGGGKTRQLLTQIVAMCLKDTHHLYSLLSIVASRMVTDDDEHVATHHLAHGNALTNAANITARELLADPSPQFAVARRRWVALLQQHTRLTTQLSDYFSAVRLSVKNAIDNVSAGDTSSSSTSNSGGSSSSAGISGPDQKSSSSPHDDGKTSSTSLSSSIIQATATGGSKSSLSRSMWEWRERLQTMIVPRIDPPPPLSSPASFFSSSIPLHRAQHESAAVVHMDPSTPTVVPPTTTTDKEKGPAPFFSVVLSGGAQVVDPPTMAEGTHQPLPPHHFTTAANVARMSSAKSTASSRASTVSSFFAADALPQPPTTNDDIFASLGPHAPSVVAPVMSNFFSAPTTAHFQVKESGNNDGEQPAAAHLCQFPPYLPPGAILPSLTPTQSSNILVRSTDASAPVGPPAQNVVGAHFVGFIALDDDAAAVRPLLPSERQRFQVQYQVVLGKGSSAVVYRGWDDLIGCYVACKECTCAYTEEDEENTTLQNLSHQNAAGPASIIPIEQLHLPTLNPPVSASTTVTATTGTTNSSATGATPTSLTTTMQQRPTTTTTTTSSLPLLDHRLMTTSVTTTGGGEVRVVRNSILAEFQALVALRHPRIVRVIAVVFVQHIARIFMEWVPAGSVQTVLLDMKSGLRETAVCRYIREALEGLAYLHSRGVVHRDLKPGNMLLSADGSVKLTDFGTSRPMNEFGEAAPHTTGVVGTVPYLAPECLLGTYSTASDVWAIGCSALHMMTGKAPWNDEAHDTVSLIYKLSNLTEASHLPQIVLDGGATRMSEEMRSFICTAMTFDWHARPTAEDLLKHRIFHKQRDS
ncbi:protein kinase, putative, partial [Bodo saltans]